MGKRCCESLVEQRASSSNRTKEKEDSLAQNLGIKLRNRNKMMKTGKKIKPWIGPLPRREHPVKCSLGDIWVKDLRASASPNGCRSLEKFLADEEIVIIDGESSSENWSKKLTDSNFELKNEQLFHLQSPITWVGETGFVQIGAHSMFQCTNGLGRLFKHGGKPKGYNSYYHTNYQGGASTGGRKGKMITGDNKDLTSQHLPILTFAQTENPSSQERGATVAGGDAKMWRGYGARGATGTRNVQGGRANWDRLQEGEQRESFGRGGGLIVATP